MSGHLVVMLFTTVSSCSTKGYGLTLQGLLFRSISAVYKMDVKLPQGIKLQRFEWDESIMMNASLNEDNIGYCVPQSLCLPSGLLNMTMCRKAGKRWDRKY